MKKKIVVIGGGVSGISAALFAIENGFDVTIIESSNYFGGRIHSRIDNDTNDSYDNGQHILVGAYTEFLNILKKLGSYEKLYIQNKFEVKYNVEGRSFSIQNKVFNNQLGLIFSFLSLNIFSISEKINFMKFALYIKSGKLDKQNSPFLETLLKYKQSENLIKIFWEPICVSTLNTPIDTASTQIVVNVLKQSFLGGGNNSKIIIPQVGLSELLSNFENYFIKKNGKILKNHSLKEVIYSNRKIERIILTKDKEIEADYFISALSMAKYNQYFPSKIELENSPIISVYLWYDVDFIKEKFIAITDCTIQWIFNKRKIGFLEGEKLYKGYFSIVISEASKLIEKSSEEIADIVCSEIDKLYPCKKKLLKFKVIKEKNATILSDVNSVNEKLKFNNELENLYIAGDWLNTELPSTIETAAINGKKAVIEIMNAQLT